MADALPKEQLLLKLLKMTTSPNDGEALTAVRKANELLVTAGWDWEKLFAGKITVVGDPFGNLRAPPQTNGSTYKPAPPPQPFSAAPKAYSKPAAPNPPRPRTPPPPPPPPKPRAPLSTKTNAYPGSCYCCGDYVDIRMGFIIKPEDYTFVGAALRGKYKTICEPCNKNVRASSIQKSAAKPSGRAANAPDLYSL